MSLKYLYNDLPFPFALSPSISRPFVLSFVEGNGLLLRTGVSKGESFQRLFLRGSDKPVLSTVRSFDALRTNGGEGLTTNGE